MENVPQLIGELSSALTDGSYECSVCSETIRLGNELWHCQTCYGMFHLPCIRVWSKNQQNEREKVLQSTSYVGADSRLDGKFRCPLCQSLNSEDTTKDYVCFCGKVTDPKPDGLLVPGSCGQPCERSHADPNCPHRCVLMCHPGACPPCSHVRDQACYCGKEVATVGCSSEVYGFECEGVCEKPLNCKHHFCTAPCHEGPCPICRVTKEVNCFCGSTSRTVPCGTEEKFHCTNKCPKMRDCGKHKCDVICHDGPCEVCYRTPERQRFCPCGKTRVKEGRVSCTDPVPSCGLSCELPLPCGHLCSKICHDETPCGPCKEIVKERCGCGNKELSYPCFCTYLPQEDWKQAAIDADLPAEKIPDSWPPKCNKPCRKDLSCRKHKCAETCCTDDAHICFQICTKKLSCSVHLCGQLCHHGPCQACQHDSYERLYCRCRKSWIDPPVPCGTKPPRCNHPCSIPRPCGHPPNHSCHWDGECPLCVVLVEKNCASHDKPMPYHFPCHTKTVSCGKTCGKPLTCCGTTCKLVCHNGECKHKCTKQYPSFAEMAKK